MRVFSLQILYKVLNHDFHVSYFLIKLIFFVNLLQFFSFNLYETGQDLAISRTPLTSYLLIISSFTRLQTFLQFLGLFPAFDLAIFLISLTFLLFSCSFTLFFALSLTRSVNSLRKIRKELEWADFLSFRIYGGSASFLRFYHVFFPIILPVLFEILTKPIENLLKSAGNVALWQVFLGFLAIFLLFSQSFCHTFYFNRYEFNENNSFARTISLVDVLSPALSLVPTLNRVFLAENVNVFLTFALELLCLAGLLAHFLKNHTFFDVKVALLHGTHVIFKTFSVCLLFFAVSLENLANYAGFLVVLLPFLYKIAENLAFSHVLAVIKDPQCNNLRSVKEISSRNSRKRFNLAKINKKFLIILSFFYYRAPETFSDFAQRIPLEISGFLANHMKNCEIAECPLNLARFSKEKPGFFSQNASFKRVFRDYVLFIYKEIPQLLLVNDANFSLVYMLFLLIDDEFTFPAISQLQKLRKSANLSFFHANYLDNFLEIIQKNLKSFENSHKTQRNSSNKCLTNFNTRAYIDIERSFLKITSQIDKYLENYLKFLENLMSEKPKLERIAWLGSKLLRLQRKIDANYQSASKTPRFIIVYLEFLQIFAEDERSKLISLRKLYNHMVDLQLLTAKEESFNEELEESLFFSENSCFLQVSGSLDTLGKIVKADENTKIAFGYESVSALQGQNITFVMPKLFAKRHDGYMRRFLRTGKTDFLFREQFLFARKFNDEIFRTYLTIKPFFDKSSQILLFLTHLKPNTANKDLSIVLVNEAGLIDSFGGPITDVLRPLFEEYKSNFYIQVLIPQFEDMFLETFEGNYLKSPTNMSLWKRKVKTCIGKDFLSNDIVNLRVYDKYPVFPQTLEIDQDFLSPNNREKARNFLVKLGSLMKKHKNGCRIYRMNCSIEDFKFDGLSFKLLTIQKIKFLYYRSLDEVRKIDSRNLQALFILPKIIMQTGLLRKMASKRSKNASESVENFEYNEEISKDMSTVLELEKLERGKKCSIFEIKEFLAINEKKSRKLQQLYNEKYLRHALSCVDTRESDRYFDDKDADLRKLNENQEDSLDVKAFFKQKKANTLFPGPKTKIPKLPTKPDKNSLKIPDFPEKTPQTLDPVSKSHSPTSKSSRKSSAFRDRPSSPKSPKRSPANQPPESKFFTENKRFIYKFDSMNQPDEPLDHEIPMSRLFPKPGKTQKKPPSSGSSVQLAAFERKVELSRMLNEPYFPRSCTNLRLSHCFLLLFTAFGFALLAVLAANFAQSLTDVLNRDCFLEKFKCQVLDALLISQKAAVFQENDAVFVQTQARQFPNHIYQALNPPFQGLSTASLSFRVEDHEEIAISLVSSLFFFADFLLVSPKTGEIHENIRTNGMRIFEKLEEIAQTPAISSDFIDSLQKQLFLGAFLAIGLVGCLTIFQVFNVFAAFGYINSVLKLLLSISIADYRDLCEKILKFKEFKRSKEGISAVNRSEIRTFYRFQSNLRQKTGKKQQISTQNAKKINRLLAVQIKVPVLLVLSLGLLYLCVFSAFLIAMLKESQSLDSSLGNLIEKLSFITKTKSYNYQLLIRLADLTFFNNSYGFSQENNEDLLKNIQNFVSSAMDQGNECGYCQEILGEDLCLLVKGQVKYESLGIFYQNCSAIGDGVLNKGLRPAVSFLLIQLNGIMQQRVDLSLYENFEELTLLVELIEQKIYEFDLAMNSYLISILDQRNTISLSVLLVIGFLLSVSLLIAYLMLFQRTMKPKILEARQTLRLISTELLNKSMKITKYLANTSKTLAKKN